MKFLFTCGFPDGTLIQQSPDDVSKIDPSRSSFYDVMCEINRGNHPTIFTLEDANNLYVVDLLDGHFEINGALFAMHDEKFSEPFRLIYFRRNLQNITNGFLAEKATSYHFGWQVTHLGQNVQRVMMIA